MEVVISDVLTRRDGRTFCTATRPALTMRRTVPRAFESLLISSVLHTTLANLVPRLRRRKVFEDLDSYLALQSSLPWTIQLVFLPSSAVIMQYAERPQSSESGPPS